MDIICRVFEMMALIFQSNAFQKFEVIPNKHHFKLVTNILVTDNGYKSVLPTGRINGYDITKPVFPESKFRLLKSIKKVYYFILVNGHNLSVTQINDDDSTKATLQESKSKLKWANLLTL